MKGWRVTAIGVLVAGMMMALGSNPGMAAPRAHVYLLRGLLNIFSLGMDTLADELNRRGVYATVDNHADWESLANSAAANYKAGKEGPIIIIGHSLGADAAMEMANYLGARGVPVALVVPFDGTQSFSAGPGVGRVLNLTQRDYAYMRRGPGFSGSLVNVDVSSDPNIDHLTIDKSPRLHARVISEVLSIVGSHRTTLPPGPAPSPGLTPVNAPAPRGTPGSPTVAPASAGAAKPDVVPTTPVAPIAPVTPAKSGDGAMTAVKPLADSGTPVIALPERATGSPGHPAN
jgi:antitoxin (DNA-binding transcriptional repressor) of toxin-antitoxin stability system